MIKFVIIYFAVRLAINPLLDKSEDIITGKQEERGLDYLRDIGVLSDNEFNDVVEMYQNKKADNQYQKYAKLLNELMNSGYFSFETYSDKMDKLKKYFKVS
jgi:hypothetical protein